MSHATKRVLVGIFLAALTCSTMWGQAATGQITGTIRDASGLAVPAAEVKVTQTATGVTRTVTSGAQGDYTLANLPIGPYQLEVTKEGFSKYVQTGIVLNVDSNPTVDVGLKVGNVSEQVTVSEDALQVETHDTGIGNVITNQQVAEMPLNGRDPHELIYLSGMATFPNNGNINTVRNYPTVVVSVAGGQLNGVSYLLDGAIHQDPYNNLSLPLPFPDALQEFKVDSSSLTAQYGYHAAAAVTAVTKSGTNEYHGDLFEFIRNGDVDARDFFSPTHDTLRRNQYGGVVGGPVLPRFRNKLFFFYGFQRTDNRSAPTASTAIVPTPAAYNNGDFTGLESPACNGGVQKNLVGNGFVNNMIAPSLLNPVAINIAKTFPISATPCGNVQYGLLNDSDENLYSGRIDYQISDKNSLFGRLMIAHLLEANTYNGGDGLTVNQYGVNDTDYSGALGDTYLFSSNVVNSLRLAATRTNIAKVPDNYGNWSNFGAAVTAVNPMSTLAIASADFNIGGGPASVGKSHNGPNPSVSDDVSWVKGTHQFQFGGSIYFQQMNYYSGVNANGTATFNGQITGSVLSDFLLGAPSSFTQGALFGFYDRQWYASLYAQDSWKITPRLTMNYGVRWEPYTSIYNAYGQWIHFDPANFYAGIPSKVFVNAPDGDVFPGDPAYACGKSSNCNDWHKFLPRIGLSYDPFGDGKTTIRAAFGQYEDRWHMFGPNQNQFAAPFGGNESATSVGVPGSLSNPWGGLNPVPAIVAAYSIGHSSPEAPFFPGSSVMSMQLQDYNPMYMNQWNLSIQRQLGSNWLVTANYIGNSTIHLITSEETNPAVYLGLGPCTLPNGIAYSTCSTVANEAFRRVYSIANFAQGQLLDGGIGTQDSGGTASYEGLYLSANKRLSKNTSLLVNYTWAHCISDVYDQQTTSGGVSPNVPIGGVSPVNGVGFPSGDRNFYRENCQGSDLRQSLGLSAVATTPRFANNALRAIASNWQVAPIIYIRSAQFFTVTSGVDTALTGEAGQTPNYTGASPYAPSQGCPSAPCVQWLTGGTGAPFTNPTSGNYGNLGYNNIKGPGEVQVNLALSRTFVLREKMTLQFRAEAFNILNHPNFSVPGAISTQVTAVDALNTANFGQVTSTISGNYGLSGTDPRILQAAMKFVF
jgi:Carboxypeptidase regulatory-like domain/TonB dependent receptor